MQGGGGVIIDSGIIAAVGAAVTTYAGRVFPVVAPEGTPRPYCTYQQIFESNIKTLDGYEGESSIDYQINFYADTHMQAKAAAAATKEYLKNYKGTFGGATLEDVELLSTMDSSDFVASKIRYVTMIDLRFVCVIP
jgi:hypothetical protein